MSLPPLNDEGELSVGVHRAHIEEVLQRFGVGTAKRQIVAQRLVRIYQLTVSTGHLDRFIVFGSFITDEPDPNDVDVFLLMADAFDAGSLSPEAQLLFDHTKAQDHFGASVFWLRRLAALEGEEATIEYWQVKRGGGQRGIVEIIG